MSWFGALIIFMVIWWLVLFIVLPFGISTPKTLEPGHDSGAPDKPRLAIKALIATIVATILTSSLAFAAEYGLIDIRELLFRT